MVFCKIVKCLPNNVYVLDAFNKQIEIVFEFYGINTPIEGDSIVLHGNLLNARSPKFTQPYSFEISDERIVSEEQLGEEIAILRSGEKNYVLKRIYG